MSEHALWNWLRDRLPSRSHFSRIESETSSGIPDVYFRNEVGPLWMELKFLRKKKLPFGDDGLRPSQVRWILDETEQGGVVFIVADIRDTVFFIPGYLAGEFNDFNLAQMRGLCVLETEKRDQNSYLAVKLLLETE